MLNKVMLIGNLGADPSVRQAGDRKAANLSLASRRRWKDRDGNRQEDTQWHQLVFWGRAFLITQDLSQHYGVYGREESITGNCHIRIAFAANKPETAELLSRMAGDMTVHLEQRTYRGARFDLVLNEQYVSMQQIGRRLLTPDEAMRLPDDDALIFVAGRPPIRATKIRYFEDGVLAGRAEIEAPGGSDLLGEAEGRRSSLPGASCRLGEADSVSASGRSNGQLSQHARATNPDLPP